MVSRTFYERYPEDFFDFYKKYLVYPEAEPNDCHKALAKLEQMGKLKAVVTQNIDGLHQKAGSKVVYELHGSVLRNYCTRCHKFYGVDAILEADGVPHCECGGVIKPDVVLYEESLDDTVINKAVSAIAKADTLIIGGTSLIVYPAAGLIQYYRGRKLVLINKSVTQADSYAQLVIHDDIASVMKDAVDALG
ncbi:MAG: NAD-dependent protein deacylase, partial [Lachnospiraceae bacterium]|nr:NAD-dependent protein deacylase [Lachnospiraceae bacterium]